MSTLRGWVNGEFEAAIGAESVSRTEIELYAKITKLRRRIQALQAVMCLLLALVRVTGCRLEGERLPDGAARWQILKAIGKAAKTLALASVLKVIGLSKSRYHAWQRADKACELTDKEQLPKEVTEPTHFRRGRDHPRIGNVRPVSTHADKHTIEVRTTSGQGLRVGFNVVAVDPRKRLASATYAYPSSQANGRDPRKPAE